MDLSYSTEAEAYRETVSSFLKANWPLKGKEKELSFGEQCTLFRDRATEAGFL